MRPDTLTSYTLLTVAQTRIDIYHAILDTGTCVTQKQRCTRERQKEKRKREKKNHALLAAANTIGHLVSRSLNQLLIIT